MRLTRTSISNYRRLSTSSCRLALITHFYGKKKKKRKRETEREREREGGERERRKGEIEIVENDKFVE